METIAPKSNFANYCQGLERVYTPAAFPPLADVTVTLPILAHDIVYLLHLAIQEQTEMGWDKLLLGCGSMVLRSLQAYIKSQRNPKAPRQNANDWMNSTIHNLG